MKKLTLYFIFLLVLPINLMAQTFGGNGRGDIFILSSNLFLDAPIRVSGSNGADGYYSSLTNGSGAFEFINGFNQTGKTIVVTFNGISSPELGLTSLNAGTWTSITMYPTVPGLTITGNVAGAMINLNGADNVTIDGRVDQSGPANLTISNTSTSATLGTSTIRFINVASSNTVKYCNLKGSTTDAASGIVFFSTSTGTTGNDGNTITYNNITNAADANRPYNGIYSAGTAAKDNSGNVISNNNIFDVLNKGVSSEAIHIDANNTAWTISGNSFYETTSFIPTAAASYKAISINNTSGTGFTVSGNYIGGTATQCGGSALTKTNTQDNVFTAIDMNVGTATASNIQGNVVRNIAWSNSGAASWTGINVAAGTVNIGTTSGNTIGATTGIASVTVTGGATNANFYGINIAGSGTIDCQNNNIGAITVTNAATNATNFYGIKTATTGTTTISNNTIGSTTTANSINATSASSGASNAQSVYGIYNTGTGSITIDGNIVAKLTNGTTNATVGTAGVINGITSTTGINTITNNTIYDLTIANANNSATNTASVCGIALTGSTLKTVTGNTIYNLSNSYATFAGSVIGLYFTGNSGANDVSRNFIHSLSVTGANCTTDNFYGIKVAAGAATYINNIISLGGNTKTTVYGFFDPGTSGNNNSYYFNTVYIGGTLASGTTNLSYAFYSAGSSNTRILKDNVLVNARSTTSGTNKHYAIYFAATGGTLTLDYNDYYISGTGGVLGYYGGNKISLPIVTGQDAHSLITNPVFINPGSTIATDYRPTATTLAGLTIGGILVDYVLFNRPGTPTMGALEQTGTIQAIIDVYSSGVYQASYTTLKAAFDKINDGTHTGVLEVRIKGSTTETATASLNASGTGAANYSSVIIFPTKSGISVTGNLAAPLIDLNGADNVTFDGRVNQAGAASLIIINSNATVTAGTSTIRFINDASNNTVKYCFIKGSTTDAASGIIFFSTTTGTTGNDGNTITYNNITNSADANRPYNGIYSAGTAAKDNSGNIISNNNIYDVLNKGVSSEAIHIDANSTTWTISGNSFYETTSFVPTAAASYKAININNTSGNGFTVSGNYIGGTASQCSGSALTKTNAQDNVFTAIDLNAGTATASNIQANVVRNIVWSNSGAASWTGINVAAGTVNLGTTSGNTIGASTGTGSVTFTGGATNANFYGINAAGTGTIDCQNNNIGAITVANTATNATNFYGIKTASSGTTTISNNAIGSTTTANSINATSTSTGTANAQSVYGIYNAGTGTIVINNNTISNATNGTNNNTGTTAGVVNGIASINGTNTITNNTISYLTNNNHNTSASNTASVCGIALSGSTLKTITGNTISNLTNPHVDFDGNIIGIYFTGNTGANIVSRNFIHSLSVTGTSSTIANIYGIKVAAGAATYVNNIISLGGNTKTTVYGFFETGISGNNNSYYYNTVYIAGTLASGSTNLSYAFYSAVNTNTRILRNNVFVNARITTSGSNKHYAIYFAATGGALTMNHNDYYTSGTGGTMGWYGANYSTIATWRTATGQDANSLQSNPQFIVPGSTIATNYRTGVDLLAYNGTGITVDYGLFARNTSPCMGAWERVINKWKGGTSIVWGVASNWTANYVPEVDANIIFDDNPIRHCYLDQDRSVGSIINATSYRMVTNGYKLTIKGDLVFSGGAQIQASATNSTVEFAGVLVQNIPTGAFYGNEVYNLTVNNPNNVVLFGTMRLLNLLTATLGRLDATTNCPTVVYAGMLSQTIGNNLFVNDRVCNLTIDNGVRVTLTSTNVTNVTNLFLINTGKKFIIHTRAKLTVDGTATNNADTSGFRIRSTTAGTGSFIEYNTGVKATVERYFWGPEIQFHYVSSPLTSCLSMVFHYAWLYSWTENIQDWFNIVPTNIPIIPMVGYSARIRHIDPIKNPGTPPNNPVLFAGTLNAGQMTKAVTYTSGTDPNLNGFNLVGNPYPSGIDWDAPSGWTKTNLNNAIYYWSVSQYASYVNGIGVNGGSRYIGNGQAFFVVTPTSAGGSLGYSNSIRTHDSATLFRASINNLLRFKVENDTMADEIVIRFSPEATTDFDNDFDAYKLIADNEMPQLYTQTTNGILTSINSLPEQIERTKVPMNLKIRVKGNYKITVSGIESFDNITYLALEDTKTHTTQLLTENPVYSFSADPADEDGRFIVWFYKNSPNTIAPVSQADVSIYGNNNTITINLKGLSSDGAEMSILNMLGQIVDKKQITSDHISNYRTELADGIYIIRVMANGKLFEKKLFLNK